MFGLFKKETPKQKLEKEYAQLMERAYSISHQDRRASDELRSQAEEVLKKIEELG